MSKVRLNDKSIRRAVPASGQIELWDDITPGFGLRISAGGARTYFCMRRVSGRLVRRTIGKAPGPGVVAGAQLPPGYYWPTEARRLARVRLAELEAGTDLGPRRGGAAHSSSAVDVNTFKSVVEAYLGDQLRGGGARLRSNAELRRKLKVDLADWHDRPMAEIRGRDIRELVREKAQESPVAANRLLSFIKRVFRWAAELEKIDADPAAAISKPAVEGPRKRFLSKREIRLFWAACADLGEPAGRLLKLALLTGQRRGEVAGMRRSEFGLLEFKDGTDDEGRAVVKVRRAWLLPAARTKRGVDHTVPLSPLAQVLIDGAPLRHFPPQGKAAPKPFDHVLASGLSGDQPISGWSRIKRRLDQRMAELAASEEVGSLDKSVHAIPSWHIHDLRATVATHMETELGIGRQVISRVLNHAEGDGRSMTARYVRHAWDREAADALDRWADYIGRVVRAGGAGQDGQP